MSIQPLRPMTTRVAVFLLIGTAALSQTGTGPIVGTTGIDGTGETAVPDRGVVRKDARIAAAGLQSGTTARPQAEPGVPSRGEAEARGSGKVMGTADRLWEIEQIKQLKARYFRFFDTKQWKEWRSLFTDDFKWYSAEGDGMEVTHASPEAFVKWHSDSHDPAKAVTVHQGHMPEIELTSDRTARGIWAMFDWVDYPTKRAFQGFGRYHEEYEKGDDGQWRIKSIRLVRLRVDQVPPASEMNTEYPRGLAPWWPPSH